MFSFLESTLLKGAEYSAKYNLNYTVGYDPDFYRCEAVLVDGPWKQISSVARGLTRPVWDLLYYQFNQRLGRSTPFLSEVKQEKDTEDHVTNNDAPSWGDLIWAYGSGVASNNSLSS